MVQKKFDQANLQTFQCILHQHAGLDATIPHRSRQDEVTMRGVDTPAARAGRRGAEYA